MIQPTFLAVLAAAWLPLNGAKLAAAQTKVDKAEKPHIVFILIDDLGWNNVGFMPGEASKAFRTPNIDALATESMVFYHAYANAPNCAASRAAMMSGMWAQRTGVYTVKPAARGPASDRVLVPIENTEEVANRIVTLGEVLHDAGYVTCHAGKWHLGGTPDTLPEAQGFDVNIAGDGSGMPDSYFGPGGQHLTTFVTDGAIQFLKEHVEDEAPMFLFLSYFAVHRPFEPEPKYRVRAAERLGKDSDVSPRFAGLVDGTDAQVGRVLEALDELGIAKETLVVFTSDNGGPGSVTHQRPLRGAKGMYYEGGIRVPLLVRWPGHIDPNRQSDEAVQLFDFYPTLAGIGGGKLSPAQPADGVDLLPLLTGEVETLGRDALFWHFPAYLESNDPADSGPRVGWRATPCSVVRAGPWKLIETFEEGRLELYDLEHDPSETHDLALEQPERAASMKARLEDWRKRTEAPVPTERNPEYRGH